jgi:hypothetical protein
MMNGLEAEVLDALDARATVDAVDEEVRVALQKYATARFCAFNVSQLKRSGVIDCD